jgi:hypothetical protein
MKASVITTQLSASKIMKQVPAGKSLESVDEQFSLL